MESIITKRTKSNTNIGKMLKIMIKKLSIRYLIIQTKTVSLQSVYYP